MKVKPFKFKLKQIDGQQLALEEALFSYLPKTKLRASFNKSLTEALQKNLNQVSFSVEALHSYKFSDFLNRMPSDVLVAVLGFLPSENKLFLDICYIPVSVDLKMYWMTYRIENS